MKKLLFAASVLLIGLTQSVSAENFSSVAPTGQTLYYETITSSTVKVKPPTNYAVAWDGYTKPTGALTIPTTVIHNGNTYTVTMIDNKAFYQCDSLTSVSIPTSVVEIKANAFYECRRLESINVPSSVTTIANSAFYAVRMVFYSGIAVNNGGNWGAVCVNGHIEDSLYYKSSAKDSLICSHPDVTNVIIPNTVTHVGPNAFFPVKTTDENGFEHWSASVRSLSVPNSVTSFGAPYTSYSYSSSYNPFDKCWNLNYLYWDVDSCDFIGFGGNDALTTMVIGNNVRYIPDNFASGDTNLTSLTIGSSVCRIGNNAFNGCSNLQSAIHIPSGTIGDLAFNGCTSLPAVTFGDGVTSIGWQAFYNDSSLAEMTIPASVTQIGTDAFSGCNRLITVNYNANIAEANNLFRWFHSIRTFNFGDNVTTIPSGMCSECINLENVTLGNAVAAIGYQAFYNCANLRNITFPASLTTIGEEAFFNCDGLRVIDIPAAVTSIGNNAFTWANHYNYDNVFFHMRGCTPPELGVNALSTENINSRSVQVAVTVPCNSLADYQNAESWQNLTTTSNGETVDWLVGELCNDYYLFARPDGINYAIYDGEDVGHVNGTGSYAAGQTATLTAVPPEGYHFSHWNDGNTENPRQVTVNSDTIFTVFFEEGEEPEGIDNIEVINAKIYQRNGQVVVEGAEGNTVTLYDVSGQVLGTMHDNGTPIRFDVPASGTYMIKIGDYPARKMVVIR